MKFTKGQLAILNHAMLTTGQLSQSGEQMPRQFMINQSKDAISICDKIEQHIVDDFFVDGECEFNTSEKSLLLQVLDRGWSIPDLRMQAELIEKLN